MSWRVKRLARLILVELAELFLRRVNDPRLEYVTLTGVDVSPDFTQAKIFFSLLDQNYRIKAEQGLTAAMPFLRRKLANRLQLKLMPRLIPIFDSSLAEEARIEKIIRQLRQTDDVVI